MSAAARTAGVCAVTVIGLGPAGSEYLTTQATAALRAVPRLYLRTERHPAAEQLVVGGAISLDRYYESADTFLEAYAAIVEEVVVGALELGHVGYAVPGSPSVLETTVAMLRADHRVEVEIVEGMSFLDLAWSRLGVDPVGAAVRLVDGEHFGVDAARDHGPLLVAHIWKQMTLADIKLAAPDPMAPAIVLSHLGLADETVTTMTIGELDRVVPDHLTCCYLPELAEPVGAALARLDHVVELLRVRCPWDAEQTHESLIRHLIEECYEAVEAIELLGQPPDPAHAEALEEELGDVLCQVMFHSVIAREEGLFSLADVATTVHDKLVSRHPHIFGAEERRLSVNAVLSQWEELKRKEKGRESLMDGIPKGLPALVLTYKIERKATGAGLGWSQTGASDVNRPLLESLDGGDAEAFGEILFAIGRLAAHRGLDAEEALRRVATRFRTQFSAAEQLAEAEGTSITDAPIEARVRFWDQAGSASSLDQSA